MSVAERNGRRQLLASLVTLLSTQMGPRAMPALHAAPALLLERVSPPGGGVLLNGCTTLVAGSAARTRALGLPVPVSARVGHALFCARIEPASGCVGTGIGVGVAPIRAASERGDPLEEAVFCDVSSVGVGDELSVEVQLTQGAESSARLVVTGRHGSVQQDLPVSFCFASSLLPALWVEGFGPRRGNKAGGWGVQRSASIGHRTCDVSVWTGPRFAAMVCGPLHPLSTPAERVRVSAAPSP